MASSVELAGLVISIVSGLAIPFFSAPLLGYKYDTQQNDSAISNSDVFKIEVFNYAMVGAENLLISVDGPGSVTSFDFMTEPSWGDNFVQGSNHTIRDGVGFAELDFLPPMTGVTITVYANTSGANSENYIAYVQSKEAGALSTYRIIDILISALILTSIGPAVIIYTRRSTIQEFARANSNFLIYTIIGNAIAIFIIIIILRLIDASWWYYYPYVVLLASDITAFVIHLKRSRNR